MFEFKLNALRQTRVPLFRRCRLELSVFILHFYASSNEDVTSSVTLGSNEAGGLPMGQKIESGRGFGIHWEGNLAGGGFQRQAGGEKILRTCTRRSWQPLPDY